MIRNTISHPSTDCSLDYEFGGIDIKFETIKSEAKLQKKFIFKIKSKQVSNFALDDTIMGRAFASNVDTTSMKEWDT